MKTITAYQVKIPLMVCTLIILFNLSFALQAQTKQIVLAAENNAPPFSDKNGNGISYNIINAAFKDSDYQIKYVRAPYARALKMVELDQVDGAFNVTLDVNNKSLFLIGTEALITANAYLYFSNSSKSSFCSFKEMPDGTSLGVMIGFEYGEQFNQHKHRFNLFPVTTQKQLIDLLTHERIAIAVMYEKIASYTLRTMSLSETSIRKGCRQSSSDAFLAFNKKSGHAKTAVALFDKQLKKLKASGEYKALVSR